MLRSLRLRSFRASSRLDVTGLTRVNLLVGRNNAGKTSVLEAAEILAAEGRPWVLLRSPTRRGEGNLPTVENRTGSRNTDIRHLFHGHRALAGSSFRIEGDDFNGQKKFVECRVDTAVGVDFKSLQPGLFDADTENLEPLLALTIESDHPLRAPVLPLFPAEGLPIGLIQRMSADEEDAPPVNYVGTTDPEYRLGAFWDRILLTPAEHRVVDALRIVEPDIERIASLSRSTARQPLPSFLVKLHHSDERIPIGSLGDGLKRLLILTVNLVNARGGLLLVDEIDTGLHHTVLAQMWKLVIETARTLDVQVIATTHSLDCVRALAKAYEGDPSVGPEISVHRLQKGKERDVAYTAGEILAAVEHDMEIR